MLLPDDDRTTRLLSRWTGGLIPGPEDQQDPSAADDAEALRVLYVAVTRARRLAALALPSHHITPVQQYLFGLGVDVETVNGP